MKRSSLGRIALVALTAVAATTADRAGAGSADARRIEDLEKENAAMRARLRRLEAESENASLRAKIERLEARRHVAPPVEASPPAAAAARLEASAPDRTIILADMPAKASPLIAPRLYSWTGFYVGANIGYGLGDDPVTEISDTIGSPGLTTSEPANIAPAGVIGGVQFGYNWQGGPNWLVGFEADFQGSAQKGTTCVLACFTGPGTQEQENTASHKIDYFGTVRGRLGLVHNNALFYVTGGGAYGRVEHTQFGTFSLGSPGQRAVFAGATRENKFGYVAGGGAEAALGGNWTGKIEYLFMDLGSTGASAFFPGATVGNTTFLPFTRTTDSRIRDHIFRVGVNYRVNGDPAPTSAYASMAAVPGPVAPFYSWSGFYAGANVGGIVGNDRVSQVLTSAFFGPTNSEPTNIVPKGVLGGVQAGYNWQAGPRWLAGFEADLQGTNQLQRSCAPTACSNTIATGNTVLENYWRAEHKLDYFATLRGRVGAVNDNVLYYMTGGAAFGHFTQTVTVGGSDPVKSATTADLIGYVVGGGIEAALGGGWTGKIEYLFMDFGSLTTTFDNGSLVNTTTTIRDHVMRLGTNYRF